MNTLMNKKELSYKQGRLFNKRELVSVSPRIVDQANTLEMMLQRTKVVLANKEAKKKAMVKEIKFEFESEHESNIIIKKPKTPKLDKQIKEHEELAKEKDKLVEYDKLESLTKRFQDLIEFVANDDVIVTDHCVARFDLKTIGNPLKLTSEKLAQYFIDVLPLMDEPCHHVLNAERITSFGLPSYPFIKE